MSKDGISRRMALKMSGAALSVGVTGSTAGCLGMLGLGDSPDVYRNWLPDPFIFDRDHYSVGYLQPAEIDEHRRELDRDMYNDLSDAVESQLSFLPMRFREYEDLLFANQAWIATGDYEVDDVESELRREDFSRRSAYEGYELHERDERLVVGVNDDAILVGPLDTVRYFIDAAEGEEQRYHEVEPDFELVTDAVGAGTFATAQSHDAYDDTNVDRGRFEAQVGSGATVEVDGETTTISVGLAFLDERDIFTSDIEAWTREDSLFDRAYDIEVDQDGRLATVEATLDTRDLDTIPL